KASSFVALAVVALACTLTTAEVAAQLTVTGVDSATAVDMGAFHSCALLQDGTVRCWGSNFSGQLGDGTTVDSPTPVAVTGITTAVAISASGWHTCALLQDGTLRCWGANTYGQLGDGVTISPPAIHISSTPVTVSGITTGDSIDAGIFHTCAVLLDGTARCWGRNGDGRLGNGSRAPS